MVTVHSFKKWDNQKGEYIRAPCKCTADWIQKERCKIIPKTKEYVDESALDSEGRYYS